MPFLVEFRSQLHKTTFCYKYGFKNGS